MSTNVTGRNLYINHLSILYCHPSRIPRSSRLQHWGQAYPPKAKCMASVHGLGVPLVRICSQNSLPATLDCGCTILWLSFSRLTNFCICTITVISLLSYAVMIMVHRSSRLLDWDMPPPWIVLFLWIVDIKPRAVCPYRKISKIVRGRADVLVVGWLC